MTALLLAVMLQAAAPVSWSIGAPKQATKVAAGERVAVKVLAVIEPGWHLYGLKKLDGGPIATSIGLPDGQAFRAAGPVEPGPPMSKYDETFAMDVEYYEGAAEFVVPVEAVKGAAPGKSAVTLNARYQACDDKQCLPPRTVKLELTLEK